VISITGLSKRFADAAAPAVDALSLEIGASEICVLIGPSGCGKTTTMRMINRMIEPTPARSWSAAAMSRASIRSSFGGRSAM
jgi:osmoprotectant transport system ATP-binding protein